MLLFIVVPNSKERATAGEGHLEQTLLLTRESVVDSDIIVGEQQLGTHDFPDYFDTLRGQTYMLFDVLCLSTPLSSVGYMRLLTARFRLPK
eukprot:scaffold3380_cov106-Cylindrotheca_fusiformis.AAC.5